jgi:hypothetical protein
MGCADEGMTAMASLHVFDPLIDDDGQAYVPLMYVFPFGQVLGVNQDSALVRPFHKALQDGKPVGKINYIFYEEGKDYFILGSFVYSPGNKIIFFPGIIDTRLIRSVEEGEILSKGILHNVDHISLESNLRVYHMTLKQKKIDGSKYPRKNTHPVKDDIFLWFSMGIRNNKVLEKAPKTQEIKLKWNDYAELKRKFRFIDESRGNANFNVTCVNDQPEENYYINFEFFVSPSFHPKDAPTDIGIYHVGLSYSTKPDTRPKIMTRLHSIDLGGFSGSLWIRVSKIIGKLKEDAIFLSKG